MSFFGGFRLWGLGFRFQGLASLLAVVVPLPVSVFILFMGSACHLRGTWSNFLVTVGPKK